MVTKKPKGLGLGLEALLGPKVNDAAVAAAPTTLRLAQLHAGRYQPRTRMDEGSLYELAESIKTQGVMQPVLVLPTRRHRATSTKSLPVSAASVQPSWQGWTRCRCWCAT